MNHPPESAEDPRQGILAWASIIDRISDATGRLASWLLLAMTLALAAIIILARFKTGFVWLQDLVIYMHGIAFMAAAAHTLLHDGHVRIDIFYSRFDERKKAVVNALGVLLFLLPTCAVIFYYSFDYVIDSWKVKEGAQVAGGVPATFILKTFIWAYVFLMAAQGLSLLLGSIAAITRARDEKDGA